MTVKFKHFFFLKFDLKKKENPKENFFFFFVLIKKNYSVRFMLMAKKN